MTITFAGMTNDRFKSVISQTVESHCQNMALTIVALTFTESMYTQSINSDNQ